MLSQDNLPTTTDQLRELCLRLQSTLVEKDNALTEKTQALSAKDKLVKDKQTRIDYLEEQLNLLRSKRYQASAETLSHLQSQLFDESQLEQSIQDIRDTLADMQAEPGLDNESSLDVTKAKTPAKRTAIPARFRRVEILIDVSDEDKQMMGDGWEAIGYEISEQVAVKQREYYVKCYKRIKYIRKVLPDDALNLALAQHDGGIKVAPARVSCCPNH